MKFLSIIGARPQFVKAAMVCDAIDRHNAKSGRQQKIRHVLVHTGQHYEHAMSGVFFEQLPLPKPDHHLGVGSGSHGAQTAAMLEGIERLLLDEKPDMTIVYGDTNSTIAGALAASKLHMKVAHLEAGLRSFNRSMPEELNRVATDHLSDLLLCPTQTAVDNLKTEGIKSGVALTGDVMLDAVRVSYNLRKNDRALFRKLGVEKKEYALLTVHRAENTDSEENLAALLEAVAAIRVPVVFPMHPRVRDRLDKVAKFRHLRTLLQESHHVRVTEPMSYLDMLQLEGGAKLVMTDSGGVQKEAFFLSVPCITLRNETEWVETLEGNWNRLAGTSQRKITSLVHSIWNGNGASPAGSPNLAAFGNGAASNRTVRYLLKHC